MKPIDSTAEILALKMLGENVDKRWTDWAYDMLIAGFDTESLVELAGETEPFQQFEMQKLTDKVFAELRLAWDDSELVLKNYTCYLTNSAFRGETTKLDVQHTLNDVYIRLDYEITLSDFSDLYYAYNSLLGHIDQWYWPDANRGNINEIINEYFEKWLKDCN